MADNYTQATGAPDFPAEVLTKVRCALPRQSDKPIR